MGVLLLLVLLQAPAQYERSFWLHASLADVPQRGYWGPGFPVCEPPTADEVRNAAALLTGTYGANRLYLLYHHELSVAQARALFTAWKSVLPAEVELVPTLLLRMYDQAGTPTFGADELVELLTFFRDTLHAARVGVYDVYPNREQGPALEALRAAFPGHVVRVGLQPGETLAAGSESAVEDTWSAVCTCRSNEDWQTDGAGILRGWVRERAGGRPIAWDLIVVAWDYTANAKGTSPGYDDANRNLPLPAGRNRLAMRTILAASEPGSLAGFSSDLCILQANSCVPARDGREASFYRSLRRGERYRGFFHGPLNELAQLFGELREGRLP